MYRGSAAQGMGTGAGWQRKLPVMDNCRALVRWCEQGEQGEQGEPSSMGACIAGAGRDVTYLQRARRSPRDARG